MREEKKLAFFPTERTNYTQYNSSNMNIIIFGPQGSGKGTQADVLSKKLNIPHISTGEIFRENTKLQTPLGKECEQYLNRGELVPDKITVEMIQERIQQPDATSGFILDGYPRNLLQAQALDKVVKIDLAMEIWLEDQEAVFRIRDRRTCSACGSIFHLITNPPKTENICDRCSGSLIIREDDREEVIKKRLATYHRQTEPLINYYNQQGVYLRINGQPPIPDVTMEIFTKLKLA